LERRGLPQVVDQRLNLSQKTVSSNNHDEAGVPQVLIVSPCCTNVLDIRTVRKGFERYSNVTPGDSGMSKSSRVVPGSIS